MNLKSSENNFKTMIYFLMKFQGIVLKFKIQVKEFDSWCLFIYKNTTVKFE